MNRAPQDLIDSLLLKGSAESALRALRQSGYTIGIHQLHTRVSQLNASGKRKAIPQKGRKMPATFAVEIPKGRSLEGCEKLLAAQIRADQVSHGPMAAWRARHPFLEMAA